LWAFLNISNSPRRDISTLYHLHSPAISFDTARDRVDH
jgi:hypothetical protein